MEVTRPNHGSCRSDPLSHGNSPMNNMLVAVRLRPITETEIRNGHRVCCKVVGEQAVVIERFGNPGGHLKSQQSSRKEYAFDIAFPPEASQDEVYTRTVKDLMPTIVDGYNATIFAYGATGAGKTHTMMGSEREGLSVSHNHHHEYQDPQVDGIIPHALTDIFRLIGERKKEEAVRSLADGSMYDWKVFISYLEVYNEQIRDLLQPSDRPLSLREDQARNIVHVAGLHQEIAHNVDEVLDLLRRGNRFRKTEPTAANQVSSRSHAVIQVIVRHTVNQVMSNQEPQTIQVEGKLSLIDLAGSERASATQNRGLRLTEGANINKSLLALANCINALSTQTRQLNSNGSSNSTPNTTKVQYRDSKLTHLLKNSLEGECRLVMIANVNPSHACFEESHNTLKYANRAKNIRIRPKKHLMTAEMTYQDRIVKLEKENVQLRNALAYAKTELLKKRKKSLDEDSDVSMQSPQRDLPTTSPFKKIKTHISSPFEDEAERNGLLQSMIQQIQQEKNKMKEEIERLQMEKKQYRDLCTCEIPPRSRARNDQPVVSQPVPVQRQSEHAPAVPSVRSFNFPSAIPKPLATSNIPPPIHTMVKSNPSMIPRPQVYTRLVLNGSLPSYNHNFNNNNNNKENTCHTEACINVKQQQDTTIKVPIRMESRLKKPTVTFGRHRTKLGEITNRIY